MTITNLTVSQTAAAVRCGEISARDAVSASLDAIQRHDGDIGAMLSVEAERSLERADKVDATIAAGGDAGMLAGVPIAIKDNICTRVGRTTCASKMLANYTSPYDAHVVERLEASGAIIVAKTNLDEFAMGSSTENSSLLTTRNPWNRDRVAGGSSGGSAAAVAARMVPAALGSDTGGSVRQPAAFTGVVGLKPTYGRVSRYGLVAYGSSLDQIGPIARDVRDVATLLSAIAGHDPRDTTCAKDPVPDYASALGKDDTRLKIGVCREFFADGLAAPVRDAVESAIDVLREQGAEIVAVDLPHLSYAIASYYVIATAEASSNLARYDGVHYGHRTDATGDLIEMYSRSRSEGFGDEVKRRIMLGAFVLSSGYYDAYYQKALKVRTLIKRDFADVFEHVDVIASPVTPTTAFGIGEKTDDPLAMYLADVYTVSANLAGIPAISVPCGFDEDGLPIGLQLSGRWFGEADVLAAADSYQRVTVHHERSPYDDNGASERT